MISGPHLSTRFEVGAVGRDPYLQLVGADPFGTPLSPYTTGIQIPTATAAPGRYLFALCGRTFQQGQRARLVGIRQGIELLGTVAVEGGILFPYTLEQVSPWWRFLDGNISWHITRIGYPNRYKPLNGPADSDGFIFRYSLAPALLYETPVLGAGYVPPNGGRPVGDPLRGDLGCIHDLRWNWRDDHAWSSLDVEFEGPCDVIFWASVLQTDPATRPTQPTFTDVEGLGPEDKFLQRVPNAIYNRVYGNMIFEKRSPWPARPGTMLPEWCTPIGESIGQGRLIAQAMRRGQDVG